MFRLATFATTPILVGIIITVILTLILFVLVQITKSNSKFSPITYIAGAVVAGVLLLTSITFCGLVSTKNALTELEMSPEYRMAQRGSDLLSNINPILSEVASLIMETSIISPESLEHQRQEINKDLWLLAVIAILVYAIGGFIMATTMTSSHGYRSNSGREHAYDGRRHRDHEYARRSHRR